MSQVTTQTEQARRVAARTRRLGAWGLVGLLAVSVSAGAAPPGPVDFAHDIVPILKAHCIKCHTDGTYKGGFSLDTREAMLKSESVVPGKSDESELVERLVSDEPDFRMPPKGNRLAAAGGRAAAGVDRPGLDLGAGVHVQNGGYVAPLKLRRPSCRRPGTDASTRSTGSSTPTGRCRRSAGRRRSTTRAFVRRVFLDVIGLLPTPEELRCLPRGSGRGQARRCWSAGCSTTAAPMPITG